MAGVPPCGYLIAVGEGGSLDAGPRIDGGPMLRYCLWLPLFSMWLAPPVLAQQADFTLPDLAGVEHRLSDYRGKWVLVNYWATWCPPCLKEIPELVEFHERHKNKDAVVIGVDYEDISTHKLRYWVETLGIHYLMLRESPSGPTAFGAITVLPTSYLVDPHGKVAARNLGPIDSGSVEDFLQESATQAAKPAPAAEPKTTGR
jgi:thiol-disulfide isomerase/thioredoxin